MGNVSLGRAVLVLGAETGDWIADLGNAEKHVRKLQDAVTNVGKGLKTFGKETAELGTALSIGLTAPILAIGGSALKMGMDVVESENLFEVSFGSMAAAARAWSTEVSNALGLNEFELRRTSGTLYTMFDAMGVSEQAAYEMSTSMVELSADMASFFNLNPDQAFEKLRAGITGEAEPLKQLGILVDETTVKQTAMRHGLIQQGEEMSQQQKVLARYVAIMEQTSKAQGDLARTADSPTNQLRAMRAQLEETAAKLGVALIPAFQKVIAIGAQLVPKIEAVVTWFTKLSPETQTVIVGLAGLAAAIGPVLVVAGTLISSVGTIVTAMSGIVPIVTTVGGAIAALGAGPLVAIVAAIGAVVLAWRHWDQITAFVSNVYTAVKTYLVDQFGAIVDNIRGKVDAVTGFFRGMYDAVVGHSYVPDMMAGIKAEFGRLEGDMVTPTDKAAEKVKKKYAELDASLQAHTTELRASTLGHQQFAGALLHEDPVIHNLDQRLQRLTTTVQAWDQPLPGVIQRINDWREAHERATEAITRAGQALSVMPSRSTTAAEAFRLSGETVGASTDTLAGKITGFFTNIPKSLGSIQESLTGKLTSLFGASTNSVLGSVISGGMNFVFGPLGGLATQLMQKGLTALGNLAMKGLQKIGGFFKNLFGGPSADELAGREKVAEIEATFAAGLSAAQRAEAGGDAAAQTIIFLRDKYIALGLTEAEALADSERLWASSRQGAAASAAVIDEINRKLEGTGAAARASGEAAAEGLAKPIEAARAEAEAFAENAQAKMAEMSASGKLSAEEIDQAMAQTARAIKARFDELDRLELTIPVNYSTGAGPSADIPIVPMADGTDGIMRVTRPTLFYSRGNEDAWFSGEGVRGGLAGGGRGGGIAIIQLDGRTIAEAVVPHQTGAVQRYRGR